MERIEAAMAKLAARLAQSGQTVAAAESCTGGLVAAALTELPGSSAWFHQGWVTYSNEAKQQQLGVRAETLAAFGAVSCETVAEMALGARRIAGADWALAVSGIAGPGGGSAEKPVGTVCFALAGASGVQTRQCRFSGGRSAVRGQAAAFVLDWLSAVLDGQAVAGGGGSAYNTACS
ncbi:nicotinamide-nucleotide amidohydrolase family protein [Neisseria leonii]|uniref:Nicotinamide-nucleotide amidohydrolase family protein n=1 Tax=Neisseria leonii TaxID=2995413 RepID=A0A9X4E2T9_9NEIS|nr:nicotinamide-nucleotide amidohydrolase family protein [Neisseria sp. 51.81]MDD9328184.1 nicotinamide-nucleotide amidohydrolase family protein [Neisseria sp. 51.81]